MGIDRLQLAGSGEPIADGTAIEEQELNTGRSPKIPARPNLLQTAPDVGEAVGVLVGVGVGVGVGVTTTGTPGTTTALAAQRCSTVAPRVPVTRAERYLPASADVIV
jgi:hypothetical protein